VQIQVTFEIDSNGIVNVSATDLETGQRTSSTISLSSGLSEQDLKKAVDDNAGMELARSQHAG
jgi:molecular chaperone DnaK